MFLERTDSSQEEVGKSSHFTQKKPFFCALRIVFEFLSRCKACTLYEC